MRNPTPEYTLIWTLTQWLVRAQANGRVIDQACERSDREGLAVLLARAGEWMAEKDSAEVSNG